MSVTTPTALCAMWSSPGFLSTGLMIGPDKGRTRMANGRRIIRPEFWIGLIFVSLLAYALIPDWWKEHSVLGRVIVGIVVAVLAFSLWRSQRFRTFVFGSVKKGARGLVYEPEETTQGADPAAVSTSGFTPVSSLTQNERDLFILYIGSRCERPDCRERNVHEIHHIKPREEGGNNSLWNLIVLCPNHHRLAQKSIPSRSQQRLWAQRHKNERYRLLHSGKWKYH